MSDSDAGTKSLNQVNADTSSVDRSAIEVVDLGVKGAASRNVGGGYANRGITADRPGPASVPVVVVQDLEGREVLSREIPADIKADVSPGADAAAVIQDPEKCLARATHISGDVDRYIVVWARRFTHAPVFRNIPEPATGVNPGNGR